MIGAGVLAVAAALIVIGFIAAMILMALVLAVLGVGSLMRLPQRSAAANGLT